MRVGVVVCAVWVAGCRLNFDVPSDAKTDAVSIAVPVASDDFEDGVLDPMWFFYNPGAPQASFVETAGELQFTIPDTATSTFAGVTTAALDLTGKALWVELAAPPPSGGGAVSYITFGADSRFVRIGSAVGAVLVVVDDIQVTSVTPSTFSEMRWWRIREDAGEIAFEIGSDGRAWNEIHRISAPSYTTSGGLNVGCGAFAQHNGSELWRLTGVGIAPP